MFQWTSLAFPPVDSLLSVDRKPNSFAGLLPSVYTRHYGTDLKAVFMLEISLVLAKAFAPDLQIRYVISSSDVSAAIKQSLTLNIILPVVKRQIAPVYGQRKVEIVCNKTFSVVMFHGGSLLDPG